MLVFCPALLALWSSAEEGQPGEVGQPGDGEPVDERGAGGGGKWSADLTEPRKRSTADHPPPATGGTTTATPRHQPPRQQWVDRGAVGSLCPASQGWVIGVDAGSGISPAVWCWLVSRAAIGRGSVPAR